MSCARGGVVGHVRAPDRMPGGGAPIVCGVDLLNDHRNTGLVVGPVGGAPRGAETVAGSNPARALLNWALGRLAGLLSVGPVPYPFAYVSAGGPLSFEAVATGRGSR